MDRGGSRHKKRLWPRRQPKTHRARAAAGMGSACGLSASLTPDLREPARAVPMMRKYHRAARLGCSRSYLVRLRDLVGAPRSRTGLFFSPPWPWRGPRGAPTKSPTNWGGRGRPAGHAAVPPAAPRADLCPWPGRGGRFFFRGRGLRDKWLYRTGRVYRSWPRQN
jgi:hypothetical protein